MPRLLVHIVVTVISVATYKVFADMTGSILQGFAASAALIPAVCALYVLVAPRLQKIWLDWTTPGGPEPDGDEEEA